MPEQEIEPPFNSRRMIWGKCIADCTIAALLSAMALVLLYEWAYL